MLNASDESYKYAGEWANDYKHGKGVLTDYTGTYEGEWIDDKVSIINNIDFLLNVTQATRSGKEHF